MAREFRLPDIGEGLTEAEIVEWHVSVGDTVSQDQPLAEIETDKSVVEVPSPFAGTVLHCGAAKGDTLRVGAVLVVVGEPGETWPGAPAAPIVGSLSEEAHNLTPAARPVDPATQRARALPLVRKLAKELGVDIGSVAGSGPDGRVTRDDVTAAARSQQPRVAAAGDERRPLSKFRRTIAANLTQAWAEVPLVTAFDEVDATRLLSAKRALTARYGVPVPIDALVVAAVLPALRAHREFNSTLDGDVLVVHGRHDIGIAVDTPDGLMVAVIADAGSMSLLQLAAEVRRLGEGARARTLEPAELSGQTFTVSNIGAIGGGYGTPLVPLGTVGILSVGRVAQRPVVRESRIEAAPMMPLSLSYDHRVIDGGSGRRFLAMVMEQLTEPVLLLA
jgi:pyruvate/2-oxoglutarate dehydrogenase complex dihydrolipoamide acyltransferase (E2) component